MSVEPRTVPAPRYRPLSRRRRLLMVALAVATAVAVIGLLLDPPGGVKRPRGPAAAGGTEAAAPTGAVSAANAGAAGSVGGMMQVLPTPKPAVGATAASAVRPR